MKKESEEENLQNEKNGSLVLKKKIQMKLCQEKKRKKL